MSALEIEVRAIKKISKIITAPNKAVRSRYKINVNIKTAET